MVQLIVTLLMLIEPSFGDDTAIMKKQNFGSAPTSYHTDVFAAEYFDLEVKRDPKWHPRLSFQPKKSMNLKEFKQRLEGRTWRVVNHCSGAPLSPDRNYQVHKRSVNGYAEFEFKDGKMTHFMVNHPQKKEKRFEQTVATYEIESLGQDEETQVNEFRIQFSDVESKDPSIRGLADLIVSVVQIVETEEYALKMDTVKKKGGAIQICADGTIEQWQLLLVPSSKTSS